MTKSDKFQLIFHGIADDSPETLRRVKAALVADLGFSADEAKHFFENTPAAIRAAATSGELTVAEAVLEHAGALVQIVACGADGQAAALDDESAADDTLIEFDLEDEESPAPPKQKKQAPKVYSIEEPPPLPAQAVPPTPTAPPGVNEIDDLLTQISSSSLLSKSQSSMEELVTKSTPAPRPESAKAPPRPNKPASAASVPPLAAIPLAEQIPPKPKPAAPSAEAAKPAHEEGAAPRRSRKIMMPAMPELPAPQKIQYARDILYAAGLSLAILAVGLWFANRQGPSPLLNMEKSLETIVAGLESDKKPDGFSRRAAAPRPDLIAVSQNPQRALTAKFTIDRRTVSDLLIELTTPAPPELSEGQIVRGEKPQPWLEKMVVQDLKVTQKPEGAFLAAGSGKLFIKSSKGSERLVANAVVTGKYTAAPSTVSARILVNLGFTELPKGTPFLFSQLPDGSYQFFLETELTAIKRMDGRS